MTTRPHRVAVIGGGVAGLTAAYRLLRSRDRRGPAIDVTVVEAQPRTGGKLASVELGGFTLESGADSFVARKPWAVDLCRELGLGGALVTPGATGAFLWTERGLVRYLPDSAFGIPADVGDVLRWPGLSRSGRVRALGDLVHRARRDTADESLGSLLRRRLGDEATDRAVAPLLAGLFAGDVDSLSASATFPELVEWERRQGSLVRGSQAALRAAAELSEPAPMFVTLEGGLSRLTDALVAAIGPERVHTGEPAAAIEPADDGSAWTVRTPSRGVEADAVIVTTPAFDAARLVRPVAPGAAEELDAIPYVSTAVVFLVYPEGTARALPEGTGFVVPPGDAPMTACTWISNKWPSPAFGTRAVVRCYVGAAGSEDVVDEPEADIVRACARHLAAALDLPDAGERSAVVRWPRAMPQYEVGHLERVRAIRGSLPGGIFVAGSAYGGAGIPDAVRDAGEAAAAALGSPADAPLERRWETVR